MPAAQMLHVVIARRLAIRMVAIASRRVWHHGSIVAALAMLHHRQAASPIRPGRGVIGSRSWSLGRVNGLSGGVPPGKLRSRGGTLKVTVIQLNSCKSKAENLAEIERLIRTARADFPASLYVLPEHATFLGHGMATS